VEEFMKAWPFHKRHKSSAASLRREGELLKPRRQDPSRDFVNVWQEISQSRVYVPQKQDVGRILKLECKSMSIESAEVMQAPPLAPARSMMEVPQPPNSFDPRAPKATFKVLTYNCLADIYANPQAYPYTPSWALPWNFRKRNLLREILGYQADVLALQEVQADHWKEFLEPQLDAAGYQGVYKQKTRESMGQDGKMDGCAILFRKSRFSLVEKHALEFNHVAMSRARGVGGKGGLSERALQCLLKDNVALVLVLEMSINGQPAGPSGRICVATTHIYQNQGFPNVKMWQVMTLVQELQKFTVPRQLPLILTGDFNSQQDSSVYEFLQRGTVNPNHSELQDDPQGILEHADIRHNLQLRDSYSALGKDFYSNFTATFTGILDYIWHTADRLRVTRVLEQIDHITLTAYTALPSPQYSSDHIALMAELEFSIVR
ncbi:hypothetical protein GUITHDRAFT_149551, partial [Guillardia theta CCMP2712]